MTNAELAAALELAADLIKRGDADLGEELSMARDLMGGHTGDLCLTIMAKQVGFGDQGTDPHTRVAELLAAAERLRREA